MKRLTFRDENMIPHKVSGVSEAEVVKRLCIFEEIFDGSTNGLSKEKVEVLFALYQGKDPDEVNL